MNANTSSNWNDFNDAEAQHGAFDLIPKGTIVPLRMTIKPGGHDDLIGSGLCCCRRHESEVCLALLRRNSPVEAAGS